MPAFAFCKKNSVTLLRDTAGNAAQRPAPKACHRRGDRMEGDRRAGLRAAAPPQPSRIVSPKFHQLIL